VRELTVFTLKGALWCYQVLEMAGKQYFSIMSFRTANNAPRTLCVILHLRLTFIRAAPSSSKAAVSCICGSASNNHHQLLCVFTSAAAHFEARYYFNYGGHLRLNACRRLVLPPGYAADEELLPAFIIIAVLRPFRWAC